MPIADGKTSVATTISDLDAEVLDRHAERLDRKRSWIVATAIREWMERHAELLDPGKKRGRKR